MIRLKGNNALIISMMAAIVGIASDFVLGYVTPETIGQQGIIQIGWGEVALWRPMLSMLMATVAFPIYLIGINEVAERLQLAFPKLSRIFLTLATLSASGWLLTHVYFCAPQFVYSYLVQKGMPELALELADALLLMLFPGLAVMLVIMTSALLILFIMFISGRTPYARWTAFGSPFIVFVILSFIQSIFPRSPFAMGMLTGFIHFGLLVQFCLITVQNRKNAPKNAEIR